MNPQAATTLPLLELIFEHNCPNIEAARGQLRLALTELGLPLQWREWDIRDANLPEYARPWGSPTILVNGQDVCGARPGDSHACCRVYNNASGQKGTPSAAEIILAIQTCS